MSRGSCARNRARARRTYAARARRRRLSTPRSLCVLSRRLNAEQKKRFGEGGAGGLTLNLVRYRLPTGLPVRAANWTERAPSSWPGGGAKASQRSQSWCRARRFKRRKDVGLITRRGEGAYETSARRGGKRVLARALLSRSLINLLGKPAPQGSRRLIPRSGRRSEKLRPADSGRSRAWRSPLDRDG